MFRKIDNKDVEKSSSVLWAHGDNVLSSSWGVRVPYSKDDLRLILNLHALFAEKLCVVDASFLHNEPLRELIMHDGYDLFLSNSVVIPMLRTSVSDFEDLEYQLRTTGRYGLLDKASAQVYASFLNDKVAATLLTNDKYFGDVLTEHYENTLLNSEFIAEAGLLVIQKDILEYVKQYQQKFGSDKVWRSIFFHFADELAKKGHPKYAARLKWLSSAIWNNVFLRGLDLKPAFPHTYTQAIRHMLTKERETLLLNVEYIEDDPLQNSMLTPHDISHLNAIDVLEIRKSSEARSYLQKAKQAAKEHDPPKAMKLLLEGQRSYLAKLSEVVAALETGKRNKIHASRTRLRFVKWTRIGGSMGIALVSGVLGGAVTIPFALPGIGLIWLIGGSLAESKLSKAAEKENRLARQQWEAMKKSQGEQRPIINVSETREGNKPPLF